MHWGAPIAGRTTRACGINRAPRSLLHTTAFWSVVHGIETASPQSVVTGSHIRPSIVVRAIKQFFLSLTIQSGPSKHHNRNRCCRELGSNSSLVSEMVPSGMDKQPRTRQYNHAKANPHSDGGGSMGTALAGANLASYIQRC